MDFFEHQYRARRQTGRLVVLFGLAVLLISAAIYLVVALAMVWGGDRAGRGVSFWQPEVAALVVPVSLVFILGGSLFKVAELKRGGGEFVAWQLGGRQLHGNTRDAHERKLLNIVEEMSLASGVPVPPVFVMDGETSINAFAAGYTPESAVVGVSEGAMTQLSRDELQGVIAHEFSHILSGDMRLNIRLIGVLHGILLIGLLGNVLLRAGFWTGASVGSRKKNDGGMPLMVLGIALMAIGGVGTFFGSWIKSAVSRQREYLADAAAVQFTRNNAGIRDALRKIGGSRKRARLSHPKAREISHMCFGTPARVSGFASFSTHPPLPERIGRVDPSWDGSFIPVDIPASALEARRAKGWKRQQERSRRRANLASSSLAHSPVAAVATIGAITEAALETTRSLMESIPEPIKEAAREPMGARAVVLALVLDDDPAARKAQGEAISRADPGLARETSRLAPAVRALPREVRLPLIDLANPALHELTAGQREAFLTAFSKCIEADKKIEVFEWVLHRVVSRHLRTPEELGIRTDYYALSGLTDECAAMLGVLAYAGHRDTDEAMSAFIAGVASLDEGPMDPPPRGEAGLGALAGALDKLETTAPKLKKRLITAAATVVAHDREVTPREAELLRAIADTLGVPMPPVAPGQRLL